MKSFKAKHIFGLVLVAALIPFVSGLQRDSEPASSAGSVSKWAAPELKAPLRIVNSGQLDSEDLSINGIRPGWNLPKVVDVLGRADLVQEAGKAHYYFSQGDSKTYRSIIVYDGQDRVVSITGDTLLLGSKVILTTGTEHQKVYAALGSHRVGVEKDPGSSPKVPFQAKCKDLKVSIDWRDGLADSLTLTHW